MVWAIHRILRYYKSYQLKDILGDEFLTPQFFQVCTLIREEDIERKKEHDKSKSKGKGRKK